MQSRELEYTVTDEVLDQRIERYRKQADTYASKQRRMDVPEQVRDSWVEQYRRSLELLAICEELRERRSNPTKFVSQT